MLDYFFCNLCARIQGRAEGRGQNAETAKGNVFKSIYKINSPNRDFPYKRSKVKSEKFLSALCLLRSAPSPLNTCNALP